MNLRIDRVTMLYVYLAWDEVPGACGYWLFKNGQRVSWTANPAQTTTRFLKPLTGSTTYGVMPIFPGVTDIVTYPQVPEPVGGRGLVSSAFLRLVSIPPPAPVPRPADPLMPLRSSDG